MRFLPKEERFFKYFVELANLVEQSSERLSSAVRSQEKLDLLSASRDLNEIEKQASQITRDIYKVLQRTFITPLEPEDIHQVGEKLWDVIRGLEHAAHRLVAYQLNPMPQSAVILCEKVTAMTALLVQAVKLLEREEPAWEVCEQIEENANSVEMIHRSTLTELFAVQTNPIQLIKEKDALEVLARVSALCEDAAHVLKNVAVKNA